MNEGWCFLKTNLAILLLNSWLPWSESETGSSAYLISSLPWAITADKWLNQTSSAGPSLVWPNKWIDFVMPTHYRHLPEMNGSVDGMTRRMDWIVQKFLSIGCGTLIILIILSLCLVFILPSHSRIVHL